MGEIVGDSLIEKGVTFASPLYKQGKQGPFPHLRHLQFLPQKAPPLPSASQAEREQRSALAAAVTAAAANLLHRFRHVTKDRKEYEVGRGAAA